MRKHHTYPQQVNYILYAYYYTCLPNMSTTIYSMSSIMYGYLYMSTTIYENLYMSITIHENLHIRAYISVLLHTRIPYMSTYVGT